MGKIAISMISVVALSSSSGCSVFMAAAGKREPNISMITIGAHRAEVELQLGSPRTTVAHEGGQYRTDTYEYELGNEPSAGRAVAHGVMDLLTFGLWEVVGTPVEAFKGEKLEMVIIYGPDDCVAGINRPPTAVVQSQPTAQASPTIPWDRLRAGMPAVQVKALLGEPSEVSEGKNSFIWFYQHMSNSYVAFKNGSVASWRGP